MSTTDTEVMAEEIYIAINNLMLPMLLIGGLCSLLICFPFFYRFRQAEYFLMENTDLGARTAMRASRRLMRGNYLHMLRLDLSFWWFWLFEGLIMLVAYADMLLPALGIVLPIPEELIMISAYVLYGLCQILLYYLCKAKVDATYVKAYDALTPPPQPPIQTVYPSL